MHCDYRGIIFIPATQMLIVSDLHLEKASFLARFGVLLPPYDTAATLCTLFEVVEEYKPKTVICLGDSFHDADGPHRLAESHLQRLLSMMEGREWFWVSGNHDEAMPSGFPGVSVREIVIDGLTFRHFPLIGARHEIAGHLHPGARVVSRGRSLRRRCFLTDNNRIVMPAFGSLTGMLNVLDDAFQGLFPANPPLVHVLGRKSLFRIKAGLLRPE